MLSIFIMVLCFSIVIFLALRKSKSEKEFEKVLAEPDFSSYNLPNRVAHSVTKRTISNPVKSKRDPTVSTTIVPPSSPTTDYTYIYPVSEPVFYDDDESKRQAYHGHGGAFGGAGATGDFSTPDSTSHHSSDHSSHSSYDSSSSSCDSTSHHSSDHSSHSSYDSSSSSCDSSSCDSGGGFDSGSSSSGCD